MGEKHINNNSENSDNNNNNIVAPAVADPGLLSGCEEGEGSATQKGTALTYDFGNKIKKK